MKSSIGVLSALSGSYAGVNKATSTIMFQGGDSPNRQDQLQSALRLHAPTPRVAVNSIYPSDDDIQLHKAAYHGDLDKVEELLADPALQTADIDKPGYYGMTPLCCAAANGHVGIMERLLKDPRIKLNTPCGSLGKTPFQYAAKHGQVAAALMLLDYPELAVNHADQEGNTALHLLAQNGCLGRPIHDFYSHNASPEVANGSTRIMAALLNHPKLEVNKRNKQGNTAVNEVTKQGNLAQLSLLLEHPLVDVSIPNHKKVTPLHRVIGEKNMPMFDKLLAHKTVRLDSRDMLGRTPIDLIQMSDWAFSVPVWQKIALRMKELEQEKQAH